MTDLPPTGGLSAGDARRAARNVGALMIASILSKGIVFGWQIALGVWLAQSEYGILQAILALFAIGASIASFGIGLIAIREIASAPQKIGKYTAAMLFTQTALSGIAYISVVIGSVLTAPDEPLVWGFAAIAGISLIVDTFGNIGHDLLIAQERMVLTSAVEIGHVIVRVALGAFAIWIGWGLLGVYGSVIVSGLGRSLVLVFIHWRDGLRPEWPLSREIALPLLVNAAPLAASAFLSLAYQHADKLMTTNILGTDNTALLGPAFLINFGVIELLSTTVLVAMYPLLSRYHAEGTGETFGYLVETLARFMLLAALPIALVLTVFARDVILFIYPPEYEATIGILQILIWYTLLTMVGNVFSKALLVQNRQRELLWIRIASLTLNIALNTALLIRFRDPRGAALASVVAEALSLSAMAFIFRAKGFRWWRIRASLMRTLLVAGGAVIIMLLLAIIHPLLAMTAGGLAYVVGVLFAGVLSEEDWDLLYRLVAAMPGGAFIRRYWQRETAINW